MTENESSGTLREIEVRTILGGDCTLQEYSTDDYRVVLTMKAGILVG
jgi:hypothetical protein